MNCQSPAGFVVPSASLSSAAGNAARTLAATLLTIASQVTTDLSQHFLPQPNPVATTYTQITTHPHHRKCAAALSIPYPFRRREKTPEELFEERNRKQVLDEALEVFRERFVDESSIDWARLQKRVESRSLHSDQALQTALDWLFSHADDPFTRYLTANQLESMKNDMDGAMCGVGLVFNADTHGWRQQRRMTVKDVVRDSPAADAGITKGDEITAIDMVQVRRLSLDDATRRLLGKEGKKVLVSFRRGDVELNVLLTRRRFEVPTVAAEMVEAGNVGRVGYIQVREFAANTAVQMRGAVQKLTGDGARLFVLDMRGNAGGLVDKAVEVAKVFLERDCVVVRFVGKGGVTTTEKCGVLRPRIRVTKEPIVVLVDAETASASELVAAALRDNCRAVVVGAVTYGKGSVQAIVPLSEGGVAVTVARYQTPAGGVIKMGKGIRPDLVRSNLSEEGEKAVKELFGRGGRRYKWVVGRLGKCIAPDCTESAENKGRKSRRKVSGIRLKALDEVETRVKVGVD